MASVDAPVVNGCYILPDLSMIRVRMVAINGHEITQIVAEDTDGQTRRFLFEEWQTTKPIPCCFVGGHEEFLETYSYRFV